MSGPIPAPPGHRVPVAPVPGGAARIRKGMGGMALLAAGAAAWWWLSTHHFSGGEHPADGPAGVSGAPHVGGRSTALNVVSLRAGNRAAAGIEIGKVARRPMRDQLTVPGRIDYDARRRLDYDAPVDGIISRVLVQVRQPVKKGGALAEISSPSVGMARDEVRRREDDRQIEIKAAEWATSVADNVESLLDSLAARPTPAEVESAFKERVLGTYREKILGAYSRLLFVEKVNRITVDLTSQGDRVISDRIVEERVSNLEVARANFESACEEARFATRQDRDRARATLASADRLVEISKEHLRTLVGSRLGAEATALADGSTVDDGSPGDTASLSALLLKTPFDGVVEDVFVARGERVQAGDSMFVVADTKMLWVRAQIHEREWTAVNVAVGNELHVTVPGAERHEATARVHHVGATVESDSRSVPLVAELANDDEDAHLKPGMFVWVDLPQGNVREALAVPLPAVMRHEGKAFVFVPVDDEHYRRVDVETGIEQGGFIEIVSGLREGDPVVVAGAFVLKSELLLQRDE